MILHFFQSLIRMIYSWIALKMFAFENHIYLMCFLEFSSLTIIMWRELPREFWMMDLNSFDIWSRILSDLLLLTFSSRVAIIRTWINSSPSVFRSLKGTKQGTLTFSGFNDYPHLNHFQRWHFDNLLHCLGSLLWRILRLQKKMSF